MATSCGIDINMAGRTLKTEAGGTMEKVRKSGEKKSGKKIALLGFDPRTFGL